MKENQQGDIYLVAKLNAEQLELVQRAFVNLVENENDIEWWDDHTLAPIDDFKAITTKLSGVEKDVNSGATVPMSFKEWVAFSSYVEYAAKHNPNEEDRYSLEDVADLNTDLEDRSFVLF